MEAMVNMGKSPSPEDPQSRLRKRLTAFYMKYAPDQLSKIGALVTHYHDSEEVLNKRLLGKYGVDLTSLDSADANEPADEEPPSEDNSG